jgi:hypothetical protein
MDNPTRSHGRRQTLPRWPGLNLVQSADPVYRQYQQQTTVRPIKSANNAFSLRDCLLQQFVGLDGDHEGVSPDLFISEEMVNCTQTHPA